MRSPWVVGSLALAGCLAAPPSSGPGDADGDGGPPGIDAAGEDGLLLTGLSSRDALTLDGRDELVVVGRRGDNPVAFVFYSGDGDLADVRVMPVPLPFDPVDLANTHWGSVTGLTIALGPDGSLVAIDQAAALVRLELSEGGTPVPVPASFRLVAEIEESGRRLLLADDTRLYVSVPLGDGEPGKEPLDLLPIAAASDATLLGSAWDSDTAAIGVIDGDAEIDVYPFTADPSPAVGADRVDGDLAPDGLGRSKWRMVNDGILLIGIDPASPRLWWHRTSLTTTGAEASTSLDDEFEKIHDFVVTKLDPNPQDLIVLGERAGGLEVAAYLDPEDVVDGTLPDPVRIPVTGLTPPYWLQAMDVVWEEGTGLNEVIVYDASGHLICLDLVGEALASCGAVDLAELTASGASTSGRPGW